MEFNNLLRNTFSAMLRFWVYVLVVAAFSGGCQTESSNSKSDTSKSNSDFGDFPVAVCDLDDRSAKTSVVSLLSTHDIQFRPEKFEQVFFIYVKESDRSKAAKLIEADARDRGYKVTVHPGGDKPGQWINHDRDDEPES